MKTILVVDDQFDVHEVIVLTLGALGHKILTAHSGEEAMRVLAGNSVDLIISDFEMPNGNGKWLLNEIRNRLQSNVPVILFSGAPSLDEGKAQALGAQAFLDKIDFSHLAGLVRKFLNSEPNLENPN